MRRSILSLYAGFILSILFTSTNLLYAQWMQTNGPKNGVVGSLAVIGTNLFAGTTNGVFLSTDNGAIWSAVDSGLTNLYIDALIINPNGTGGTNLFAGTSNGIFLSTDYGTIWSAVDSGLTNLYINALTISPNGTGGTNLFVGTIGGVFLSTNNGISWTAATGLQFPVTSFLVSGTNLFAGTNGEGVYLSTNYGTSWTAVNSGLMGSNRYVFCFTVSLNETGGTNVFAGTVGGVCLSTNNGISWTPIDSGLTPYRINALLASGTNLFAGSGTNGVYLSTNNGTSWTAVNSGLNSLSVQSLVIIGDTLFAGTGASGGVWIRPLSDMITSVDQTELGLPTNFSLEQNYPNPFNPSTTVNYSVPKAGLVTIKVYDILGREATTLVNEQKNPGNYSVQFNAARLASGVYFYRMQSGSFIQTKKLILMK